MGRKHGTHWPFPMLQLLYATHVLFKAFKLPTLSALSTVFEWRMATWLSLCMAVDIERDKTLNTALESAHLVPGAYMDEILLRVTPSLRSPSAPKSPLTGPSISVMPSAEICESPVEDDFRTSPVKDWPEDLHSNDAVGCMSEESVCFIAVGFQDTVVLIALREFTRIQIQPLRLTPMVKRKTKKCSNIAGRINMITKDSR